MERKKKSTKEKIVTVVVYLIGFAVVSTLIWLVWNWVVPGVTGWGRINWLQAFGIKMLADLVGSKFSGDASEVDEDEEYEKPFSVSLNLKQEEF